MGARRSIRILSRSHAQPDGKSWSRQERKGSLCEDTSRMTVTMPGSIAIDNDKYF